MLISAREKLSREGETKSLKEKRVGSPPGLRFLQREWPSTQGHPAPRDNFAFSHVNGSLLFIKKWIKSSVAWNGLTYLLSLLKDCNFTLNWPFQKRAEDWARAYFLFGTNIQYRLNWKMGHVIWKTIQKLVNSPNLTVIGLHPKAWYT